MVLLEICMNNFFVFFLYKFYRLYYVRKLKNCRRFFCEKRDFSKMPFLSKSRIFCVNFLAKNCHI